MIKATDQRKATLAMDEALDRLSCSPVQARSIVALLQCDVEDAQAVVSALSVCPSLSARVLSVINSAAFGLQKTLGSIPRAVQMLGPRRARTVALAHGLRMMNSGIKLPRGFAQRSWTASVQKAVLARFFCETAAPRLADTAYALAMMQDIGLPLMISIDPALYRDGNLHRASLCDLAAMEREHFGFDHAMVGSALLTRWNGPEMFAEVIRTHHQPPSSEQDNGQDNDRAMLTAAVFFSSLLSHLGEPDSPRQQDYLHEYYRQWLAFHYASPETFLAEVNRECKMLMGDTRQATIDEQRLLEVLGTTVADEVMDLSGENLRLASREARSAERIKGLHAEAITDPLSNLLNRRGFMQLAERRLSEAAATGEAAVCLMVDLDGFKRVNDTHGHDVGDAVLHGVAILLRRSLPQGTLIGRLGGDEFAVLLAGCDQATAAELTHKVYRTIANARMRVDEGLTLEVQSTVGAAYIANLGERPSIDAMLRAADVVMYQQKTSRSQRGCFRQFDGLTRCRDGEKPNSHTGKSSSVRANRR